MGLPIDISQTETGERSAKRILVLDDNPNLSFMYAQALGQAGHHVFSARTIQEARELLANCDFDVFVANTHIDARDSGVELLREQIARFARSGTKIIMMSSYERYQSMCQEIGADVAVERPLAINRLIALTNRLTV
jgi:two-component system phosphate regulon response regulator PhoB